MATKKVIKKVVTTTKRVAKTEKVGVVETPITPKPIAKTTPKVEVKPKPKPKPGVKAKPKPKLEPEVVVKEEAAPKPLPRKYGVCNSCLSPLVKLLYDSHEPKPRYFICCNNKACPKYRFVLSWDPGPP